MMPGKNLDRLEIWSECKERRTDMEYSVGEIVDLDGYLVKVLEKKKDHENDTWYFVEGIDENVPFRFFTILVPARRLKKV